MRQKSKKSAINPSIFWAMPVILLFSGLAGFIYSNTFESPFVFDDLKSITENPSIRLTELSLEKIKDAVLKSPSASRPIANLSFALNYYFHQYNFFGYHLVNLIVHILAAIFLYLFINTTLNLPALKPAIKHASAIAFFAALIWLAHPIQTQSVTYIVQRMNSLAAMFYILSFWLYVKGRLVSQTGKKWGWFGGAALTWVLALGCKQNAAILPFFTFLYEWYFFQELRVDWLKRKLKIVFLVFFLIGIISLLYLGLDPSERLSSIHDFANKEFTFFERVMTQFRVINHYISLIFLPHPSRLNLDYDFLLSTSLINPITTLFSLVAIAGLIGPAIYFAKKERLISFCILWFFGNHVIESSIIPLAIIFEHRNYLPSMMVFLVPVVLAYRYIKLDWLKIGLLSVLVIGLSAWTYQRNRVWQNEVSLWTDVVNKSPDKARPHVNLGHALFKGGRIDDAITQYQKALQANPNYYQAYVNLGGALARQGKLDAANMQYLAALKIKPDMHVVHNNLGALLVKQDKTEEAIAYYLKALEIKPDYPRAHFNLGAALTKQGRIEQAIKHYQDALKIWPNFVEAHNNLGAAFLNRGQTDKAIAHYTAALQLNPSLVEAYNNMGIALMQAGKIEAAIIQFQKALQIKPGFELAEDNLKRALAIQKVLASEIIQLQKLLKDNPENAKLHFQLGNLYVSKGDRGQAIQQYKKTLRLNPNFFPALNNMALVNAANKDYYKALLRFLEVLNHHQDDVETYYNIACMYSRLKRTDESIEWLKKAVNKGYTNWDSIKTDSDLDNIRSSLAYKELIKGH